MMLRCVGPTSTPAPHTPVPGLSNPGPLEANRASIQAQLDYYLYGGIAATEQVLPAMLERGSGAILCTTGGTSRDPLSGPAEFATTTIGSGALRGYALTLHQGAAGAGVHVAHIPLFAGIGNGAPAAEPAAIAQHYWLAYTERDGAERVHDVL